VQYLERKWVLSTYASRLFFAVLTMQFKPLVQHKCLIISYRVPSRLKIKFL
jgi:hypothetical protein